MSQRRLRILALHGHAQTSEALRAKSGALRSECKKLADFEFVQGPHRVNPCDHSMENDLDPGWTWYYWDKTAPTDRPVTYDGYVDSLRFLDTVFRDKGPFDGVLGFSMGSTIVAALCHIAQQRALQSPDSAPAPAAPGADADEPTLNATPSADPSPVTPSPAHPPGELPLAPPGNGLDPGHYPHIAFGFACLFSGLVPRDVNLKAALTAAPLHTPSFHCWGTGDNIVVPERSAACAGLFTDPVVVTHDGGHLLPSAGPVRKGLKAFLQGRLAALQPQG